MKPLMRIDEVDVGMHLAYKRLDAWRYKGRNHIVARVSERGIVTFLCGKEGHVSGLVSSRPDHKLCYNCKHSSFLLRSNRSDATMIESGGESTPPDSTKADRGEDAPSHTHHSPESEVKQHDD